MGVSSKTKPPLGTGERFRRLVAELKRRGVKAPEALAAWIGRKVHGKALFQKLASLARKRRKGFNLKVHPEGKKMKEAEVRAGLKPAPTEPPSSKEVLEYLEELVFREMEPLDEEETQVVEEVLDELEAALDVLAPCSPPAPSRWSGGRAGLHESAQFLEALDSQGKEWEVLLIRPGTSKNRNHYPPDVLTKAAHLFEGKKAFVDHATGLERKARPERSVRDVIGWFDSVKTEPEGLLARFHILESAQWLRALFLEAYREGKKDLVGFSIDAEGKTSLKRVEGALVRWVESIDRVNSVDVVTEPAAGGQVMRLVASLNPIPTCVGTKINARTGIKEDLEMLDSLTWEELKAARPDLAQAAAEEKSTALSDLLEKVKRQECRLALKEALVGAELPEIAKTKMRKRFEGKLFEENELTEAIKEEKEFLARLDYRGQVKGFGQSRSEIGIGDEESDRYAKAMDGFFFGQPVDGVRPFRSLQEAFSQITGQGFMESLNRAGNRLTESLSTASFDQILADSMTRRMLKEYSRPDLSSWRKIVESVSVGDFRTQRRLRFGGYANLPTVAQGASYSALTSPTDEEAIYVPAKRGGTEDLTLEMIKNDDVGAIRRIPIRLGRAAAQTVHEFVFDFLKDNGNIYDSTALFTAGHGNLGSAALSSATLVAGRNAMLKQTELNSGKPLAIRPSFLVVPIDLEETAFQLINSDRVVSSAENQPNFIKVFGLELIVVEYWTDTNNWYLVADPAAVPTVEIGFLEGKEEPELFVQDMENVGSMFSADKVTYKIRHIYGGAVMDYRGLYGAIVA